VSHAITPSPERDRLAKSSLKVCLPCRCQHEAAGIKNTEDAKMTNIDLGNNESLVTGVFPNNNGTFTAVTLTKSKDFKTKIGAEKWLNRKSGN